MLSAGLVIQAYATWTNPALPLPDSTWRIVFYDNFNSNRLDTNKWTTCYDWVSAAYNGCTNSGNDEQEWYSPSQVQVDNGSATLTAERASTKGWFETYERLFPYRSGMISTGRDNTLSQPKWSGTYGYFEARLKTTGGQGVWPAFWLLPANGTWPPEIDVMELLGQHPHALLMTYHWPTAKGPAKDSSSFISTDFTKDWHTYAINWQPGHIDWYVDGVLRKVALGKNVPSTPMMLIINLAIGGRLPGNATANTPMPATLMIDYVRVRQR